MPAVSRKTLLDRSKRRQRIALRTHPFESGSPGYDFDETNKETFEVRMQGIVQLSAVLTVLCATACRGNEEVQKDSATMTKDNGLERAIPKAEAVATTATRSMRGADTLSFWDGDYDPNGSPTPADGWHAPGTDCGSCHTAGEWIFSASGTVVAKGGKVGLPHVQVGIRDGAKLRTTYSATNGNFWLTDNGTSTDFANAEVRIRNAQGEKTMRADASGSCNKCHRNEKALVGP